MSLYPSRRFLETGMPTRNDKSAIGALGRRRDYLVELNSDSHYDRHERSALDWALAVVAHLRKDGEMDVEFQEVERDRDERLAEEAGEVLAVTWSEERWACEDCEAFGSGRVPERCPGCGGANVEQMERAS